MSRQHKVLVGLLLSAASISIFFGGNSTAEQQPSVPRTTVNATELGNSVELIGRLGIPMTEACDVTGRWILDHGTKASPYVFRVTAVAGKQLESPVEFNQAVVTLDWKRVTDEESMLGETWSCKAIELGQFRNVTEKHWDLFYDKDMRRGSSLKYGDGPFVSELLLAKRTLVRQKGERLR